MNKGDEVLADLILFASKMVDLENAEMLSRTVFEASSGMGEITSMYQQLADLILNQKNQTHGSEKIM